MTTLADGSAFSLASFFAENLDSLVNFLISDHIKKDAE